MVRQAVMLGPKKKKLRLTDLFLYVQWIKTPERDFFAKISIWQKAANGAFFH